MLAYHIDSSCTLKPNQEITLTSFDNCPPIPNGGKLYTLDLLSGLSQWGKRMLFDCDAFPYQYAKNTQIIELVFELIRQKYFPEKFSRLQSIFAVTDMNDLKYWLSFFRKCEDFPKFTVAVLEVPPSHIQTFDASYLKDGFYNAPIPNTHDFISRHSTLLMIERAHNYWSGKQSSTPQIECLIKLPVIVKEVHSIKEYLYLIP